VKAVVEGKKRVVGWDGSSFLSFSSAVVCREKLERERERETKMGWVQDKRQTIQEKERSNHFGCYTCSMLYPPPINICHFISYKNIQ